MVSKAVVEEAVRRHMDPRHPLFEDVVSETWISAHEKSEKKGKPLPISKIAEIAKGKASRTLAEERQQTGQAIAPAGYAEAVARLHPQTQEFFTPRQEWNALMDRWGRHLTQKERDALYLKVMKDLSLRDMVWGLKITPGAAENRVYKAQKKLYWKLWNDPVVRTILERRGGPRR